MKKWKRWMIGCMAGLAALGSVPVTGARETWAAYKNMNDNEFISVEKITAAKTGKTANITFKHPLGDLKGELEIALQGLAVVQKIHVVVGKTDLHVLQVIVAGIGKFEGDIVNLVDEE